MALEVETYTDPYTQTRRIRFCIPGNTLVMKEDPDGSTTTYHLMISIKLSWEQLSQDVRDREDPDFVIFILSNSVRLYVPIESVTQTNGRLKESVYSLMHGAPVEIDEPWKLSIVDAPIRSDGIPKADHWGNYD